MKCLTIQQPYAWAVMQAGGKINIHWGEIEICAVGGFPGTHVMATPACADGRRRPQRIGGNAPNMPSTSPTSERSERASAASVARNALLSRCHSPNHRSASLARLLVSGNGQRCTQPVGRASVESLGSSKSMALHPRSMRTSLLGNAVFARSAGRRRVTLGVSGCTSTTVMNRGGYGAFSADPAIGGWGISATISGAYGLPSNTLSANKVGEAQ